MDDVTVEAKHMTDTRWNLATETKALIVVDMQNGFLRPDGFMAAAGLNIDQCIAAIAPNQRVITACRKAGIPVIFTRYTLRADYKDAGLLGEIYPALKESGAMVAGTRDWEIAEELKPMPGDIVLDKQRYSSFYNTNLEVVLRGLGITLLVVTGVTTNICVESTVRDAFFRDFKVTVIEDCVGAVDELMQQGPLHSFRYGFGDVVKSDEFISAIKRDGGPRLVAAE
jgi:ureidoacrylate peracid hydrolase